MKLFIYLIILIPNLIFSQKEEVKYWSKKDTLQFSDFRGKYIDDGFSATSVIALKVSNIGLLKDMITILPIFNFEKSTFFNVKSKYVLKHEQVHFDISELFTRKIRKELIEYYRRTYDININFSYKIYDDYLIKYHDFEKKYDFETKHGQIIEKQIEWNNKIKKELEKYKDYTSKKYLEYIDDL